MAETVNIGAFAEQISQDIFLELGWERLPLTNSNWNCVRPEHEKLTHPSDVVFTYREPYKNIRTYINCDLKSYAKGSINKGSVRTALQNLSLAISCADISEEWQKQYKNYKDNYQIIGLLFIYNHDSAFDTDFANLLQQAMIEGVDLEKGRRIIVFGPKDICYLNTIVNDIKRMRGEEKIGKRQDYSFYFPDLITKKLAHNSDQMAATVEMLTAPFQVLKYKIPNSTIYTGLKIYYRRPGATIEEFIYLFDYLFHFQIIENDTIHEVEVRLPDPDPSAPALFETAKTEYGIRFQNDKTISDRLSKIKFSTITNIVTQYSKVQVGMRYE